MTRLASWVCLTGWTTACGTTTLHLGDDRPMSSVQESARDDATVPGAPTIDSDNNIVIDAGSNVVFAGIAGQTQSGANLNRWSYPNGTSYCVAGSVLDSTDDYFVANFSVQQAHGENPSPMYLSATSITVRFTNDAGSPLRLQLEYMADQPYCHDVSNASGLAIPLSEFSTQCWADGGTFFDAGTAFTSIGLEVPGRGESVTPFDFCFLGVTVQ